MSDNLLFSPTLQHRYMEMTFISDIIKNAVTVYRQRRTFIKSFSKRKTWHCKSIAKRI